MFKRLLVPLDGSGLAESVLPATSYLARRLQATIVLFHAIEQRAPAQVHGQHHLLTADEAQAYLKDIAARLAYPGASIETDVHAVTEIDIARSIAEHINELDADLVMLSAHGSGGLRDVFVGNVAQQVIQHGTTPVFFVRPKGTEPPPAFALHKILVPLDGTPMHQPALPVATELARACSAAMHLLTVVPTTTTLSAERGATRLLLPTTMMAVLDLAQRGAVEYLQGLTNDLVASGLPVTAEVARGDVVSAVLDATMRTSADLVVLATHARASFDAFWSGSLTPKIMARSPVPVLLVRVTGQEAPR